MRRAMRKLSGLIMVACGLGLGAACTSFTSDDSCSIPCTGADAGGDATVTDGAVDSGADGNVDCQYPDDAGNAAECPATYSSSYQDTLCPQIGLSCAYPGKGDGTANGCYSTAVLLCNAPDAGFGGHDAAIFDGADAGSGFWTAAQ